MTTTFAHWPRPLDGVIEFVADCPCGAVAVWEQHGSGPGGGYRISCRGCSRR